ncbi:hypothetical protein BJ508DRAFT_414104 [Ascobolus immersus RN42]|uniref:Uncharacterized protein n=1 Tax=Ascobolus immersus RN42 TaxID=1160509 RepID=A0A3N4IAI6_ASCIM|nr:hypothetical protein BJ508DRAFT_414104 [Ascobolus immersus RN42]
MPRPFKLFVSPLPRTHLPPLPSPLRMPQAHYTAHLHPSSAHEPRARKVPPQLSLTKREKSIIGSPLTLLPRTPRSAKASRHSTYTPTTPNFDLSPGTPKRSATRRLVRKKGSRSLILEKLPGKELPWKAAGDGEMTPITPDMVRKVNQLAELEKLTREVWRVEKAKCIRMDRPVGRVRLVEVRKRGVGLGIRVGA